MCGLSLKNGSSPPPTLFCPGFFSALDPNDPNPGLRECEWIDGKGPYSIKKANAQDEEHFPDDNSLDRNAAGTFITFK